MVLIRMPLFRRGRLDWPPDLFSAGAADCPVRLVEAEAGVIERNSDIVEHTPDLLFRILDDVFVEYTQHASR